MNFGIAFIRTFFSARWVARPRHPGASRLPSTRREPAPHGPPARPPCTAPRYDPTTDFSIPMPWPANS